MEDQWLTFLTLSECTSTESSGLNTKQTDSESTQSSVWSSPPTSVCFCTQPKEETNTVSHGADDQGFGMKTCQEAVLSVAAAGEHLISSSQEGHSSLSQEQSGPSDTFVLTRGVEVKSQLEDVVDGQQVSHNVRTLAGGNPGITDSKLRRSSSLPQLPTRPNLPSVPRPYTNQYASFQSPTSAFQKPTSSMQHVDVTQVDSTITDSMDSLKSIQSFDGGQSLDIGRYTPSPSEKIVSDYDDLAEVGSLQGWSEQGEESFGELQPGGQNEKSRKKVSPANSNCTLPSFYGEEVEFYQRPAVFVEGRPMSLSELRSAYGQPHAFPHHPRMALVQNAPLSDVDEIAQYVGLDSSQLDKRCSEEHLQPISGMVYDWWEFANELGLTDKEKQRVECSRSLTNNEMRALEMLKLWRRKNDYSFKVHYRELVSCALSQRIPDRTLAGKICELLQHF